MGYADRLVIKKCAKGSLIALGVLLIFFSACSIAFGVAALVKAWETYRECHLEALYGRGPYGSNCLFYDNLNKFSVTGQGIWVGCAVIVAAALTIDFSRNPIRKTGYISLGFMSLSILLTFAMIVMEPFPVTDYQQMTRNNNDDLIWSLHCASLAIACALLALSVATTVVLSVLCCCGKAKTYSESQSALIPMAVSPQQPVQQAPATVGVPYVVAPAVQTPYVTAVYPPQPNISSAPVNIQPTLQQAGPYPPAYASVPDQGQMPDTKV